MRVYRAANGGSLDHHGCLPIHLLQFDASLLQGIAPGVFGVATTQNDPTPSQSSVSTSG